MGSNNGLSLLENNIYSQLRTISEYQNNVIFAQFGSFKEKAVSEGTQKVHYFCYRIPWMAS